MNFLKKGQLAAIIGNVIEYYDQALYGYLAFWIAPLFFPSQDIVNSLILTYLLLPLGFLSRPVGAYFIGRIGDTVGRKKALIISIVGMGAVTGLIGCLPTYQDVGMLAPIMLILLRLLQTFFIGAEFNGGAIYTLENTPREKQGLISGLYSCGSVIGFLSASTMGWVVSFYPAISWRVPFYLSFITAFIGWILRLYMPETSIDNSSALPKFGRFVKKNAFSFLWLITLSGMFNTLYSIPTIFFNSYIPLISTIPVHKIMAASNISLILYMISLIFFGRLSDKWTPFNVMLGGAMSALVLSYPLFMCLRHATFTAVIGVKICFSLIAGSFNGSFHAFILKVFEKSYRYRGLSISYSIGSQLIGGSAPVICLGIWKSSQSIEAPSLWLIFCIFLGTWGLVRLKHHSRLSIH